MVSTKSFVRRRRLEVLMQGWQPTYSLFSTSSSIKSCTWFSVSFIRPSTLTEPGVISRNFSIYSGLAKDRRAEWIWADRSLVWNTLVSGIISR